MHTGKERQQEKENVLSIDNKGNLEEKTLFVYVVSVFVGFGSFV